MALEIYVSFETAKTLKNNGFCDYMYVTSHLTKRDCTGCAFFYSVGIPSKEMVFETYEEACEGAIKYYLENIFGK